MHNLQEALELALQEIAENCDVDIDHFVDSIPGIIPELVDDIAVDVLSDIKKEAFPTGIERHKAGRLQFEQRLMSFWKKPLDLLDVFITCATEAGSEFNSEFRNQAVLEGDAVFEALTRLHGKACQVSKETFVLLRSGYADGALARWRTLHELTVVACVIDRHGQEVAEKYLLHSAIQRHNSAVEYHKQCEQLGQKPFSQEEMAGFKEERDSLVERFGKPFETSYGWAVSVTDSNRPGMADLEECVGLKHFHPYYNMANGNIHADSHGTYFRLGLSSSGENVILAGPSNEGLADPGHSTAISLCQVTTVLLARKPKLDYAVYSYVLRNLVDEIGDAFIEAHRTINVQLGGGDYPRNRNVQDDSARIGANGIKKNN